MASRIIQIPEDEARTAAVARHLVADCGLIGTQLVDGLEGGIVPVHPAGAEYCTWQSGRTKVVLPNSVARFPVNPVPPEALCRLAVFLLFVRNEPRWAATYVLHKMTERKTDFWRGIFDRISFLIAVPRSLCDAAEVWHPALREFASAAAFRFAMVCGGNAGVDAVMRSITAARPWVVESNRMFDLVLETFGALRIRFLAGPGARRKATPDLVLLGVPIFVSDCDCALLVLSWLFSERTMWIDACPAYAPAAFRLLFDAHPELRARRQSVAFLEQNYE